MEPTVKIATDTQDRFLAKTTEEVRNREMKRATQP
jgi:hypothetical protein